MTSRTKRFAAKPMLVDPPVTTAILPANFFDILSPHQKCPDLLHVFFAIARGQAQIRGNSDCNIIERIGHYNNRLCLARVFVRETGLQPELFAFAYGQSCMAVIARALPNECASKGMELTPQKRWLRKDPNQRASWYRLCDSHGEIA